MQKEKGYLFIEPTTSLCHKCEKRVSAKIVKENDKIYVIKNCLKHGDQKEILEEDAEYFFRKRLYDKPGTISKTQTKVNKGCPFDCGLCPNHEQHTCIGLIEITNKCNLKCPNCYANSGEGSFVSLDKISKMMDLFIDSEFGNAEILQVSGGEPTLHPEIIDILKLAKEKKIKYVMLNTNGLKIAEDIEFVKKLSEFRGGFEVYLQFDGLDSEIYKKTRGRDILNIKKKAIENLTKFKIPITLVATVQRGINDKHLGEIVKFGLDTKYIRGINFQPVAFFGRNDKIDTKNRITLSGILKEIEDQTSGLLLVKDFIPLPCNVDRVAVTYLKQIFKKWIPLSRKISVEENLSLIDNTFLFTLEDFKNKSDKKASSCECNCMSSIKNLVSPRKIQDASKESKMDYIDDSIFRISVTSFVDIYNFDIKSVQKECVHIITEDLRKIPFSTYNMLYRNQ